MRHTDRHLAPSTPILASEITPQAVYQQRRQWLQLMASGAADEFV